MTTTGFQIIKRNKSESKGNEKTLSREFDEKLLIASTVIELPTKRLKLLKHFYNFFFRFAFKF